MIPNDWATIIQNLLFKKTQPEITSLLFLSCREQVPNFKTHQVRVGILVSLEHVSILGSILMESQIFFKCSQNKDDERVSCWFIIFQSQSWYT